MSIFNILSVEAALIIGRLHPHYHYGARDYQEYYSCFNYSTLEKMTFWNKKDLKPIVKELGWKGFLQREYYMSEDDYLFRGTRFRLTRNGSKFTKGWLENDPHYARLVRVYFDDLRDEYLQSRKSNRGHLRY